MNKNAWSVPVLGIMGLTCILVLALILNNMAPAQTTSNLTTGITDDSLDIDNGDLKIDWSRYSKYDIELEKTTSIARAGVYHITGELLDEPLIINVGNDKVKIILDNVTIKNSTGPAIACYNADDLVIELVGENTLSDGSKYDTKYDEDVKGAIYSKADLTFEGTGSLTLTAKNQDGIVSKDDLKFISGNYIIDAADDAIRGKDSVYIVNGDFNITSHSDGIKSTNNSTAGKGFVLIENGHIKIASGDDAIHAETSLLIYNGNIDITKSYEGLEAHKVAINGGEISIISSDDGVNASSSSTNTAKSYPAAQDARGRQTMMMDTDENSVIMISSGNVYINASGDGIDSNGYVYFNGGTVTVDGPTNNGNGALDSDLGIVVKAGTVVAVGASGMAKAPTSNSTQYSASIFFNSTLPAETKVKIKKADGTTIIRHTSAKSFDHMMVSLSEFEKGETYTIYVNDEKYETLTIFDTTTIIGENKAFNGGGFNGGEPDGRPDGSPDDINEPPSGNEVRPLMPADDAPTDFGPNHGEAPANN